MTKKRTQQKGIIPWLFRAADLFFPFLSELQVFTVALVVLFLYEPIGAFVVEDWERSGLLVLVILAGIGAIVIRHKFSVSTKALISAFYYAFFTIIALNAIDKQVAPSDIITVEFFNYWLTRIVLITVAVRGIIALIIARFDLRTPNELLAQNFRDTQYRPVTFIVAGAATLIAVVILRAHYLDPYVCIMLSLAYVNMFMGLLQFMGGKHLIYGKNDA